jgi:hypothetical protein
MGSSTEMYTVHMKLSLCLSLSAQTRGYTVGTTAGFQNLIMEALSPVITPLNPAMVPTISYEYLFYHPSSDRLRPPTQRKARGLLSGSCTLGIVGHRLRPTKLDTAGSLQRQNGW